MKSIASLLAAVVLSAPIAPARAEDRLEPLPRLIETGTGALRSDAVMLRCAGLETLLGAVQRGQGNDEGYRAAKRRGAAFVVAYASAHGIDARAAMDAVAPFTRAYHRAMTTQRAENRPLTESFLVDDLAVCLGVYARGLEGHAVL